MSIKLAKKVLAAGLAAVTLAMPVSAETVMFFNDGYVVIEDSSNFLREGETLTVTAVEKGTEWENFEDIALVPKEKLEFYGTFLADSDGGYFIEFSPDDNGEYTVYVGTHAFDEPRKYEICYINKTDFETAVALLNADKTEEEFAGILSSNKEELGLFHSIFNDVDMQKVTEFSKADVLALKDSEPLQMIDVLEKAALIAELNAGDVENIGMFSDIANISDNKYFGDEISAEITDNISGKNIDNFDEFDNLLIESIILANVNNKPSAVVKEVLTAYYSEIGIVQSKITDGLCTEIVKKGNFNSLTELSAYINSYKGTDNQGVINPGPAPDVSSGFLYTEATEQEQNVFQLPFEDIQGYEWAEEAIKNLYLKSVINGKSEKSFCPGETVTREEFVKMITQAFKMNLVDGDMNFSDVPEDAWFTPYVRTSYNAQIVYGLNESEFGIGKNITREDLCVMVSRALYAGDLTLESDAAGAIEFYDEEEISDYASEAVKQLSGAGIVNGFEGKFRPKDSATRAEAAKIIYMVTKSVGL